MFTTSGTQYNAAVPEMYEWLPIRAFAGHALD